MMLWHTSGATKLPTAARAGIQHKRGADPEHNAPGRTVEAVQEAESALRHEWHVHVARVEMSDTASDKNGGTYSVAIMRLPGWSEC